MVRERRAASPAVVYSKRRKVYSGVAGQGGPGVRTPPELPGIHEKRKNPVRIFSYRVMGVGARQPLMTNSPGPLLNIQTRLRRCPLGGIPLEFLDETYPAKTRGMGLLYGENWMILASTVFD